MTRRIAGVLLLAVLAWLVAEPIAIVAIDAVRVGGAWTLSAVRAFAAEPNEWRAVINSALLAVASVITAGVIGVSLALVTRLTDFPGRRVASALLALPAVLPPLVGVVSFLFLYGESGVVARAVMAVTRSDTAPWRFEGAGAVLLVHATTMYVYCYLVVRGALASLDPALLEAATALGADRWRTLRTVVIPMVRPAIANGALLTALSSLASFSAPYVFGGGFRVLPTQLVSTRLNGDVSIAMVETIALMALSLVALLLASRTRAGSGRGAGKGIAPAPRRSGSRLGRASIAVAVWGATLWLLLPHIALAVVSLVPRGAWTSSALPTAWTLGNYATILTDPVRWRPFGTSLWMAAIAAALAAVIGLAVAVAARDARQRLSRWLDGAMALPWAVPGTVYAIALATMFSVTQLPAGRVVLIGTIVLLPLAYLIRSLPVVGRPLIGAMRALDPALDEAAAALGAGAWRTFRSVTLPLLGPVLAGAVALAFVTGLGDFMTSIILYTYDTRPVSLEILGALREGNLGVAAAFGVVLAMISTAAFLLAERGRTA